MEEAQTIPGEGDDGNSLKARKKRPKWRIEASRDVRTISTTYWGNTLKKHQPLYFFLDKPIRGR
jgi:hypothetical protein